jgi:hypothetical protein
MFIVSFGGAVAVVRNARTEAGLYEKTNKRTNNGKSKDEIQGSFASLRMTT